MCEILGQFGDVPQRQVLALRPVTLSEAHDHWAPPLIAFAPTLFRHPRPPRRRPRAAKTPPHIEHARKILTSDLFPNDKAIANVTIKDWSEMSHYPKLKRYPYRAWTHRSNLIYLRKLEANNNPLAAAVARDFLIIIMRHEAEHIRQFHANDGRTPRSWEQMVRFEAAAYSATATWLNSAQAKTLIADQTIRKSVAVEQARYAQAFKDSLDEFAPLGSAAREAAFRAFLMGKNTLGEKGGGETLIPPDTDGDTTTLSKLYGRT